MKNEFRSILYRAANSRLGLAVRTNDPERLRAKLYAIRREDPALADLTFSIPAEPDHLYIINKARANANTEDRRAAEENS